MAEFKNGEVTEFTTNFIRKARSQYHDLTKHESLANVRLIDMESDSLRDMCSYTKR